MAQCATTVLAGAVPRPCVRGARGRFGGLGPVPGVVSPPFPPSRPAFPALCVAGRPVRLSLTLARWYAIPRGLCVTRARSGCPSGSPRVPFVCVCARAPAVSAPPPPLGGVACAPRAVPALGAGRAVPRGPCPSACPGPVPCSVWRAGGGAAWSRFPPTWLGVVRPPWGGSAHPRHTCAGGWGGVGGGAARAPRPPFVQPGGASGAGGRSASFRPSTFPGQAPKQVSLASFWSWRAWPPYRSGSCLPAFSGDGPCGVLAHWRGFACSPRFPWEPAAGAGGRAVLRPFSRAPRSRRGEGGPSPLPRGGGGRRPCGLRAGLGGEGGGVAPRPPCSPSGGRPAAPYPAPPLVVGAFPPDVCVPSGPRGRPVHRPAWRGGGGGGGAARGLLPRGPLQTRNLPLPSPSGQHCGCHDALVFGGAAPILFRCASACRPRAWSARRSGALVRARPSAPTPAGAGSCGRWGARCAGPAAFPPPASRSLLGEGGRPFSSGGLEGRRSCGPQARGGAGAGGGGGGAAPPPPAPPPRRASACHPSPRGILVLWASPGGRGRRVWPGRPPTGLCGGGGGGGGGGVISSPRFAPLPSPGWPLKGPLCLRRPGRRRSAVGR